MACCNGSQNMSPNTPGMETQIYSLSKYHESFLINAICLVLPELQLFLGMYDLVICCSFAWSSFVIWISKGYFSGNYNSFFLHHGKLDSWSIAHGFSCSSASDLSHSYMAIATVVQAILRQFHMAFLAVVQANLINFK